MSNFERMLQLAEEVFAVHDDPAQLQVDEEVLARLQRLHPAARGEAVDGDGPVAWVLVIPTTAALMEVSAPSAAARTRYSLAGLPRPVGL